MEERMRKLLVIGAMAAALALVSCPDNSDDGPVPLQQFSRRPVLNLSFDAATGNFQFTRDHSEPRADRYDVYYRKGSNTSATLLERGTKVEDIRNNTYTIPAAGYSNGEIISAVIVATSGGFETAVSQARQATYFIIVGPDPFVDSPGLTFTFNQATSNFDYTITHSVPQATNYHIRHMKGTPGDTTLMNEGTLISNVSLTGTIPGTGYLHNEIMSIIVMAEREGYIAAWSPSRQATYTAPSGGSPGLQISFNQAASNFQYTITPPTPATPAPVGYDLRWAKGSLDQATLLSSGIPVIGVSLSGTIPGATSAVFANNEVISVIVIAKWAGPSDTYSPVRQATFTTSGDPTVFTIMPDFSLDFDTETGDFSFMRTRHSTPRADRYDLYWMKGDRNQATLLNQGTLMSNVSGWGDIPGDSFVNGEWISVVMVAILSGYTDGYSAVKYSTYFIPLNDFVTKPNVTISLETGSFQYNYTPAAPAATSYDLRWMKGAQNQATLLAQGTLVSNVHASGTISGASFVNNEVISVLVIAKRDGYNDGYADVKQLTYFVDPGDYVFIPGTSPKRGVGYDFRTLGAYGGSAKNSKHAARDMALLQSGTAGISWFYNWGPAPDNDILPAFRASGLEFCPMAWNTGYNIERITTFSSNHPNTRYLLAYNEPNFRHQAALTPQAAANDWSRFRNTALNAKPGGLRIVSPAMNFSGGGEELPTPPGIPAGRWNSPYNWLDDFFAAIGPAQTAEIEAISVHTYPWWASAVKGILHDYKRYGKPIWLTEFCGWEDLQNRTPNWQLQAEYMSMVLVYLEMDPDVHRYAWYLPKGHVRENVVPVPSPSTANTPSHNLITEVPSNPDSPLMPELSPLGLIYTNIPTFGPHREWTPAGRKMDASQFTSCNMANHIGVSGWSNIVQFRPVTDTDKSAGVLEIFRFTNAMWVEYQVNAATAKTYNLTLRYNAAANTTVAITVNGASVGDGGVTLPRNDAWATRGDISIPLVAGQNTIRLRVTVGDFALNWLRFD